MDAGGGSGKKRTFVGEALSKEIAKMTRYYTTVFVSKYVTTYK
jgi:hypothetical protein